MGTEKALTKPLPLETNPARLFYESDVQRLVRQEEVQNKGPVPHHKPNRSMSIFSKFFGEPTSLTWSRRSMENCFSSSAVSSSLVRKTRFVSFNFTRYALNGSLSLESDLGNVLSLRPFYTPLILATTLGPDYLIALPSW